MCSISHDFITFVLPISLWLGGGGFGSRWIGDSELLYRIKFPDEFLIFCSLQVALKLTVLFPYWKCCQRLHLRDPCGLALPK